ncbi:MAG: RND transporter [Desulfurivibrionaceae bacterium]|nr:hypothetical protein [Desulfobulbales bacterium]MDT8335338.1 RND transporter [Desulfurivibrionaceae bacterium]
MYNFLDKISYTQLAVVAIILGLAPLTPTPHLVEKFIMLGEGRLDRPVDILDLFFHLFPAILLLIKLGRERLGQQ